MPVGNEFLTQLSKTKVIQETKPISVKDLIIEFQNERIHVPPYQRSFVWDNEKQCRFIESLFMNIPIPPIFLLSKHQNNSEKLSLEVIDGVQRLTTLVNFNDGFLKLRGLLSLPDLNQATFPNLPQNVKDVYHKREIHTVTIHKETHPEIQFEVFARLNQGSVSLNDQELRNCIFHGEFNDFLIRLSRNPSYRELLSPFGKFKPALEGKTDKNRMLDVELILRFFAIYELFSFTRPGEYLPATLDTFNLYMRIRTGKESHLLPEKLPNLKTTQELENLFLKALEAIKIVFKDNQFKRFNVDFTEEAGFVHTTFNKAVFDIQMIGFVDFSLEQIAKSADIIYDAFLDVSSYDTTFIDATKLGTNSKVNERMNIWRQRVAQIIENPEPFAEKFKAKVKLFNTNPICEGSRRRIETLEEAYFENAHLYHRAFRPLPQTTRTRSSAIRFHLDGTDYEMDNSSDVWDFLIEYLRNNMPTDDPYTIRRLTSIPFVGTQKELSSRSQSETKKFKSLRVQNSEGEHLWIDVSGNKIENIQKMQEITSLFSFMSDFDIL
jgi:hypothetical protein